MVWGLGSWVWGLGLEVSSMGIRGLEFRVWGAKTRALDLRSDPKLSILNPNPSSLISETKDLSSKP